MLGSTEQLSLREREILHSIVRSFIENGEPIGSRTISRMASVRLSPASIRNVMADLSDAGFLAQPHTSAGRVPTASAFQDFAASMSPRQMAVNERERILARFQNR